MSPMKISLALVCSVSITALLVAGCGKSDETPPPSTGQGTAPAKTESATSTAQDAAKAAAAEAQKALNTAKVEGQKAVETVKTETQTVVSNATKTLTDQTSAVTTQFNNLLTQAKGYVTDKKYQDALTTLQQITALKLTPEQQKTVDDLKGQVQKLMTSQTVTNILGGFRK